MALLMAVAMIVACFAGTALAVDITQDCSLTISIPDEFAEDLAEQELIVDLYKVADADNTSADVAGYDTYKLNAIAPFTSLAAQITAAADREAWEAVAQAAAGIVTGNATLLADPAATGTTDELIEELESGLYLIITHGALTDYIYNEEGEDIAGIAQTTGYEFHFAPQLVSLPMKEGTDGTFNTAQSSGDWIFDGELMLKPVREVRNGSIRVNKTLTQFGNGSQATFVFSVDATLENDPEYRYSNVFTLDFTAAGTKGFTVEDLPVGAVVTVTEVYSGAGYQLTPGTAQTQSDEVEAADTVTFTFTNAPDGTDKTGYGILNTFTSDGTQWNWNADYNRDSAN